MSSLTSAAPTGSLAPGGRRGGRRPRATAGWLFAAPSLLILGVFIVLPIIQSLRYSLYNWRIGAKVQEWVGFDNYAALFEDPLFWNALRVTLIFSAVSVVAQLALGYAAAAALQRESLLTKAVRSVFFFPTVVALATIGMVWRFLLDPNIGLIGGLTEALGGDAVAWLQDPNLALPTVIAVSVWKNLGFTMIILLAGLKGVPAYLYEAAALDGARGWKVTWHVTLPSIRPTILLATVLLTINSLQVFDLVYVMTQGGPLNSTDTLVTMLYREGFQYFNLGYASAIAWVLFVIIALVSVLQMRLFRYNDVD